MLSAIRKYTVRSGLKADCLERSRTEPVPARSKWKLNSYELILKKYLMNLIIADCLERSRTEPAPARSKWELNSN